MTTTETKPENQETTKQSGIDSENPSTQQDRGIAEKFYGKEGEEDNKDHDTKTDADKTDVEADKKEDDTEEDDKSSDKESDSNDEGKKEDSESSEDQDKTKAPEKYELKLEKDSLLTKDQVEEIEAFSKQQGFSNDQAQELLNREEKLLTGYKETLHEEFEQKTKQWLEDIKADKQLGGDNFKKNIEQAKRVVDRFATQEFKNALNESGFGNHPELVRTFVKIGEAMSEDTYEKNSADQQPAKKTMADKFYG